MKFNARPLSYRHTLRAAHLGYITQSVVVNFLPLLFVAFMTQYAIALDRITFLITAAFAIQLGMDYLSSHFVDRIGYRISIVSAHFLVTAGLVLLALLPGILPHPYPGILISVCVYAVGGGLIEVLISPIVEACPTPNKEAAMSALHAFYNWGHVGVVGLSTLFLHTAGLGKWPVLVLLWALLPLINMVYFLFVPLYPIVPKNEPLTRRQLFKDRTFWILFLLMICAGASEHAMNQWASAFAESALHLSKTVGDLLGPCAFSLLGAVALTVHAKKAGRWPLRQVMILCGILCAIGYLLAGLSKEPFLALAGCAVCGFSVGIFWPGTFSLAGKLMPLGGTAMYAFLALGGDMGCVAGPTVVGLISNAHRDDLQVGLTAGLIFPLLLLAGLWLLVKRKKRTCRPRS